MYLKTKFILLVLALSLVTSCGDDEPLLNWCEFSSPSFAECTDGTSLSPQQLALLAVGTWTLRARACGFCSTPGGCENINRNEPPITARFTADGRLEASNIAGDRVSGTYEIRVVNDRSMIETDVEGIFPRFFFICSGLVVDDDFRLADEEVLIWQKTD